MLHGKTASKKRGKKERGAGKREGGKQGLCWRFSPSVLFLAPASQTVGPQTGCPRTCLLPRPAQRLSLFSRADACSQGAAELCLPVSPGRTHRPTIASSLGKGTQGFASSLPPPIGGPRCLLGLIPARSVFSWSCVHADGLVQCPESVLTTAQAWMESQLCC